MAPGRQGILGKDRQENCLAHPLDHHPVADPVLRFLVHDECDCRETPGNRLQIHRKSTLLAGSHAWPCRWIAPHSAYLSPSEIRHPPCDYAVHLCQVAPGDRHRLGSDEYHDALLGFYAACLHRRLRRWGFQFVYAEHLGALSETPSRYCAWDSGRYRQFRGKPGAIYDACDARIGHLRFGGGFHKL